MSSAVVSECAVTVAHFIFKRTGITATSHSAASRAARPIPKGVTGNGPVPRTTSWVFPPWGPEPLLSPMVSCLHSHRTAEYCVRYSRAGGMKVLKCGTATPSCSDAWTQESSRIHSHLPESRLCALGSSRINSHLHEARKASIALLGHRGSTRISTRLAMHSHQCSVRGSSRIHSHLPGPLRVPTTRICSSL